AGLAVAADRQQNPVQRPELTHDADQAAQVWITALANQLTTVESDVGGVSAAGRQVLEKLQAFDLPGMDQALTSGGGAASRTDDDVAQLAVIHDNASAAIDEWRLGPTTSSERDQLGAASAARVQGGCYVDGRAASSTRSRKRSSRRRRHCPRTRPP